MVNLFAVCAVIVGVVNGIERMQNKKTAPDVVETYYERCCFVIAIYLRSAPLSLAL